MSKGRVYCRDKRGRQVPWGLGKPWIDFSLKGPDGKSRRFRERIKASKKSEAELQLAKRMFEEAQKLEAVIDPTTIKVTVASAFEAWRDSLRHRRKKYSAEMTAYRARKFVNWFGAEKQISDVRKSDLVKFRDACLDDGLKASTVKTYLGSISSFFSWCADQDPPWVTDNPVKGVRRPRVQATRPRALGGWKEVESVLEAVQEHPMLYPAYVLAFCTLAREEIMRARWKDIDWDEGTIQIDDGKTDARVKQLPLIPKLMERLRAIKKDRGYIVPSKKRPPVPRPWGEELQGARARFMKNMGASLPSFHPGRHTIGTILAKNTPLPVVQKLLRHANPATTARYYINLTALDARDALEGLGD